MDATRKYVLKLINTRFTPQMCDGIDGADGVRDAPEIARNIENLMRASKIPPREYPHQRSSIAHLFCRNARTSDVGVTSTMIRLSQVCWKRFSLQEMVTNKKQ
ncbi:hypothetical protein Q3G72_021864 [Acer saccharum]|nr:hypothetical protein Q3G72_021864 [Acer saccharum]